jgi:hypothetical protein
MHSLVPGSASAPIFATHPRTVSGGRLAPRRFGTWQRKDFLEYLSELEFCVANVAFVATADLKT